MEKKSRAAGVALLGMLFALALALSVLEGFLPALVPVPGIKPGLSNIVVMYCVFLLGARQAFLLAVLKAGFVLLVRGGVSGCLSFCGGVASVAVMLLLLRVSRRRFSYAAIGMAGAVIHNLAQLAAASLILRTGGLMLWYLPALVLSGMVMGFFTASLLRALMPFFERHGRRPEG